MIRSATPVFALLDRLRREPPRPGVDRWEAAGTPQQNPLETFVWAGFVTLLTAALSWQLLGAAGTEGLLSVVLILPVTFALLHAGIVLFGVVADLLGSRVNAWILGCSAVAVSLIISSEGTHPVGWAWLAWIGVNAAAWSISSIWKTFTADSR